MLETNLPELKALANDSDPIIPVPPNIRLLTGPLRNPSDPNFFDLTPNDDIVQLASGILRNTPGGLRALAGNDFVRGSDAAEQMNGNSGNDTLIGGCGDDTIRGGAQDFDYLYGECGNDVLNGNQGIDYAWGGTGNDFVRGGQGNDWLLGNSGNDTLIGDAGIDKLWGGADADLFVLRREAEATSRPIGSDIPRPTGNFPIFVDIVPADFILDYDPAQGDTIGLAGGLTRNDIVLSEKFLIIGDAREFDSRGFFPILRRSKLVILKY